MVTTIYSCWKVIHQRGQASGFEGLQTAALYMQHGLHLMLEAYYPIGPEDILSLSEDQNTGLITRVTAYPRDEMLKGLAENPLPEGFTVGLSPENRARLEELKKEVPDAGGQ